MSTTNQTEKEKAEEQKVKHCIWPYENNTKNDGKGCNEITTWSLAGIVAIIIVTSLIVGGLFGLFINYKSKDDLLHLKTILPSIAGTATETRDQNIEKYIINLIIKVARYNGISLSIVFALLFSGIWYGSHNIYINTQKS
jgi:hypothetical protein